jgi:hypothetical protein
MKMKGLYAVAIMISVISCNSKDYKYKIYGKRVMRIEKHIDWQESNLTEELVDVIAYTDTIHGYNNDSIWYYNSDGSKMTILSPYRVAKIK